MKTITSSLLIACFALGSLTSQAQNKKVALTSFWVSKHIGFEELGGGAGMVASIASLAEDPNFDLQPVLDHFYQTFSEEYAKQFPFDLLPEDQVLGKAAYQSFEGRFNESKDKDAHALLRQYLTPKTYKPLQESLFKGESSNQMQMVEMFKTEADGVMFVSMGYDFIKKPLPFTAGVRAYIRIKIWNKEGKRVLSINQSEVSKGTIGIIAGIPIMDPEELLPLCEDASKELIEDLNKKLGKIAKKAAKKL